MRGHAPTRSFGAVFRYPLRSSLSRPGGSTGPLTRSPGGAHGVLLTSFAGLLPLAGGRDVSAAPGPRVVPASSPAPIDFRRGDPNPSSRRGALANAPCGGRTGQVGGAVAFDFWASFPFAVRSAAHNNEPILPWALPLAGLSGDAIRASARARPRCGSSASGRAAEITLARSAHHPLVGFGNSFPVDFARATCDRRPRRIKRANGSPPARVAGPSAC